MGSFEKYYTIPFMVNAYESEDRVQVTEFNVSAYVEVVLGFFDNSHKIDYPIKGNKVFIR